MNFCQLCKNHPRLPETFPFDVDEENENDIDVVDKVDIVDVDVIRSGQ